LHLSVEYSHLGAARRWVAVLMDLGRERLRCESRKYRTYT
jgi:hypothetical protein